MTNPLPSDPSRRVSVAKCVLAAGLVALVAACGTRTSVTGTWDEPRSSAVPFEHVLVVAVSPNSRLRRSFEQAMADLIATGKGSTASASISMGKATQPLTRDTISAMVRASGADAVLVTRLASRRVALEEGETRVGVKTQRPSSLSDGPGLVNLFSQTYHEYEEPGEISARSDAVLESSIYAAEDGGRLVYTLTTKAEFDEGQDDVVANITTAIVRQLRRERLIR